MTKKYLFLFLSSVGSGLVTAQSIKPQVIASCGNYYVNGGSALSWTIGETVASSYINANNTLTQGFHQPQYVVAAAVEDPFR